MFIEMPLSSPQQFSPDNSGRLVVTRILFLRFPSGSIRHQLSTCLCFVWHATLASFFLVRRPTLAKISYRPTARKHSQGSLVKVQLCENCVAEMQDLREHSAEEIKQFLDSFDTVLTDCDGVLWSIEKPIDGAVDAVKRLQELGKKVFFVTNNSIISAEAYCKKLQRWNYNVTSEQIVLPAKVICWYLKKINFQGQVHAICSPAFRQLLHENGIDVTESRMTVVEDDIPATIELVRDRPSVKAVVCDFDADCNWMKMTLALSCLKREDVLFLAGALDEILPIAGGARLLGPGPMTKMICEQSGREPIQCCKPSKILRDYILEVCKVTNRSRCLFIGDTIRHDMQFAELAGFKKFFVGSGVDTIEDANKIDGIRPNYYLPSLGLLLPILNDLQTTRSVNGDNS